VAHLPPLDLVVAALRGGIRLISSSYLSNRVFDHAHRPSNFGSVKLYNLDHVGIAVNDLDAAIADYFDRYGVEPNHRQVVADQGVEEAMIPMGGSFVQLLGALSPHTPVGRFLERKGEGLHHIAYAVLDIDEALAHRAARGSRLIDEFPRVGGSGARIAFVHPSDLAGTLIELVEHPDG
jgi:methylmalonyl-CoA/ethylmalonyl-CoA epimerase